MRRISPVAVLLVLFLQMPARPENIYNPLWTIRQNGAKILTFSADGTKVAFDGSTGAVMLRDVRTGKLLRSFGQSTTAISAIAFTKDGQGLATGDIRGTIRFYRLTRRDPIATWFAHLGGVASLDFSTDDHLISGGKSDHKVRSWEAATGYGGEGLNYDDKKDCSEHVGFIENGGGNRYIFCHDDLIICGPSWDELHKDQIFYQIFDNTLAFTVSGNSPDSLLVTQLYDDGNFYHKDCSQGRSCGQEMPVQEVDVCQIGDTKCLQSPSRKPLPFVMGKLSQNGSIAFLAKKDALAVRPGEADWPLSKNIREIAISPNGDLGVSADADSIMLWDLAKIRREAAVWKQAETAKTEQLAEEKNRALYEHAEGLARGGNFSQAANLLKQWDYRSSQNVQAQNALGAAYCELEMYKEAEEQFSAAAQAQPDHVWNWYRGRALLGLGDIEGAKAAIAHATGDGPDKNFGKDVKEDSKAKLATLASYLSHLKHSDELEGIPDYSGAAAEVEAALKALQTSDARQRLAVLQEKVAKEKKARIAAYSGWIFVVSSTFTVFIIVAGLFRKFVERRRSRQGIPPGEGPAEPPHDRHTKPPWDLGETQAADVSYLRKSAMRPEDYINLLSSARAKGGEEAVRMIVDADASKYAWKSEWDADIVADAFIKAGRASQFLREQAQDREPGFYPAFAAAFALRGDPKTALALLERKRKATWSREDCLLAVECAAPLGTLEAFDLRDIREEFRIIFAEALTEANKNGPAWVLLGGISRRIWKAREYGLALRLCHRLELYTEATPLFHEARKAIALQQAPELPYYYAILSEKQGDFGHAKAIYDELLQVLGGYKDAAQRLKNLEGISAEELSRVSSIVATQSLKRSIAHGAAPPSSAAAGPPPVIAERFEILLPLGVGGMGLVYKARDLKLGKDVAIKKMKDNLAKDPKWRQRFLEEAKTLAELKHPAIVGLEEVVEFGGSIYLVCELVAGETLEEILASRGRIPPKECSAIIRAICAGLGYSHGRGVMHLDLKPSNIMRDKLGQIKILDFGLSRHIGQEQAAERDTAGTPAYMAPEQHEGRPSLTSDIFALGATLYELVAGVLPFKTERLYEEKRAELYLPLGEEVPRTIKDLVSRCLKANPAERPSSVAEVLKALSETLSQSSLA